MTLSSLSKRAFVGLVAGLALASALLGLLHIDVSKLPVFTMNGNLDLVTIIAIVLATWGGLNAYFVKRRSY